MTGAATPACVPFFSTYLPHMSSTEQVWFCAKGSRFYVVQGILGPHFNSISVAFISTLTCHCLLPSYNTPIRCAYLPTLPTPPRSFPGCPTCTPRYASPTRRRSVRLLFHGYSVLNSTLPRCYAPTPVAVSDHCLLTVTDSWTYNVVARHSTLPPLSMEQTRLWLLANVALRCVVCVAVTAVAVRHTHDMVAAFTAALPSGRRFVTIRTGSFGRRLRTTAFHSPYHPCLPPPLRATTDAATAALYSAIY